MWLSRRLLVDYRRETSPSKRTDMLQPRLLSVKPVDNCKLVLEYETGEKKMFDVAPYATGGWFAVLKDESYFRTVHLLSGGTGIKWADGHDIAPHELYENSETIG